MDKLEQKIMEFIEYLDSIDQWQGDTPCLHMSFFRNGNNRRKMIKKNNSPMITLDCQVFIKTSEYKIIVHKAISGIGLRPSEAIDECRKQVDNLLCTSK